MLFSKVREELKRNKRLKMSGKVRTRYAFVPVVVSDFTDGENEIVWGDFYKEKYVVGNQGYSGSWMKYID